MATLGFKFSSWFNDVFTFALIYWFPWDLKARMTLYDTDFAYYTARIQITIAAFWFLIWIVFKIMETMDKAIDLKIKKATLKAKEELADYIKAKTKKLNEK